MIQVQNPLFAAGVQRLISAVVQNDRATAERYESMLSSIRDEDKGLVLEHKEQREEILTRGQLHGVKAEFLHTVEVKYLFINDLLYFNYNIYRNSVCTHSSQMRCFDPCVKYFAQYI